MTKLEIDLFTLLSSRTADSRCDDYTLPNTDDHWAVVEGAMAWNVNKTAEQYRADVGDAEYRERPSGDGIDTSHHLIHAYLRTKAIRELTEAAT